MKIIFIISFPPAYNYSNNTLPDYSWRNPVGEIVGVWRQDRGHVFAKDVKKLYPEIEFEVWRPDYRADKEYVHKFDDGVVHRSFPAQKRIFFRGLKPNLAYTSRLLFTRLSQLIHERKEMKDLLIHIPADFSFMGFRLMMKFRDKAPFLHTVHLNPELLNIELNTRNPLRIIHRYFIRRTYESHKKFLKEVAVSAERVEFFRQNTRAKVYRLDFLNFDFSWGGERISKKEARNILNLPLERKILFSSSRLVPEKQIDILLRVLAGFSEHDFLLIISGTGEEYYEEYLKNLSLKFEISEKIMFTGFLSDSLKLYYCASDVFINTSISEAGPVSVLKAISLGIPVITTNTGNACNLLIEQDAGIIIDKNDPSSWSISIEKFFSGECIKTIDPFLLKEKFDFRNGIRQLVNYYQYSINNFWAQHKR